MEEVPEILEIVALETQVQTLVQTKVQTLVQTLVQIMVLIQTLVLVQTLVQTLVQNLVPILILKTTESLDIANAQNPLILLFPGPRIQQNVA